MEKELVTKKKGGRPRIYDEVCSVDGCDGEHRAKGFCMNHYQKDLRRRKAEKAEKNPLVLIPIDEALHDYDARKPAQHAESCPRHPDNKGEETMARHDWKNNPGDYDLLLEAMSKVDGLRSESDRINGTYPQEWWENVHPVLFVISDGRIHISAKAASSQFYHNRRGEAFDGEWKEGVDNRLGRLEDKLDRVEQMVELIFEELCGGSRKKASRK